MSDFDDEPIEASLDDEIEGVLLEQAPSTSITLTKRPWHWTPNRQRAAILRSQGLTWAAVSQNLGVAEGTLLNWSCHPDFKVRVREILDEFTEEALNVLKRAAVAAAEKEVWLLDHGQARHDEVKLGAAQDILDRLGVKATPAGADDATGGDTNVNVQLVIAAEDAFSAALRQQPVHLGDLLRQSESPLEGDNPFQSLPLPGNVPARPLPGTADLKKPSGGHEPDGRD